MAAAGIGDVNGDGYDDFAFGGVDADAGHHAIQPSRVEIHLGAPVSSMPRTSRCSATPVPISSVRPWPAVET